MDPVTQGLLGAGLGQAVFVKKLRKKAIVIGGLAAMTPDLDIFYGNGVLNFLKYHRGYTHALIVDFTVGILLGLLFYWIHKQFAPQSRRLFINDNPPSLGAWVGLFVVALTTHPLLDWFTTYGTQLALPFSDHRFAINAVAVIDPFYSIIFIIAIIMGWRRINKNQLESAGRIGLMAVFLSTAYLFMCLWVNTSLEKRASEELNLNENARLKVNAYPLLFQPFFRYICAQGDIEVSQSGDRHQITMIGFTSFFSHKPIDWITFKDKITVDLKKFGSLGEVFYWFSNNHVRVREIDHDDGLKLVQLLDARYPNPESPNESLWGIQGLFKNGEPVSAPEYFRTRSNDFKNVSEAVNYLLKLVFKMWRGALGVDVVNEVQVVENEKTRKIKGIEDKNPPRLREVLQ